MNNLQKVFNCSRKANIYIAVDQSLCFTESEDIGYCYKTQMMADLKNKKYSGFIYSDSDFDDVILSLMEEESSEITYMFGTLKNNYKYLEQLITSFFVLNSFEPKIKLCESSNKYISTGEIKIVISRDEIDSEILEQYIEMLHDEYEKESNSYSISSDSENKSDDDMDDDYEDHSDDDRNIKMIDIEAISNLTEYDDDEETEEKKCIDIETELLNTTVVNTANINDKINDIIDITVEDNAINNIDTTIDKTKTEHELTPNSTVVNENQPTDIETLPIMTEHDANKNKKISTEYLFNLKKSELIDIALDLKLYYWNSKSIKTQNKTEITNCILDFYSKS